jgi:NitT/TauT family transport system substrate-binding protein
MSTSAKTTQPATSGTPLYKRRRRRIYAIVAAAVVVIVGLSLGLTLGTGSSGPLPNFVISLSTGTVANSDSIIVSDRSLKKTIPAHVTWVPFTAGVTAVAEMKSGSLQSISGVGNPPTVGAIGTGTGIDIVLAQSFDSDELLVPTSVTQPSQLAGKSVAVLVGSSEDYELEGWLKLEGLTGQVKIVSVASEQAAAAAYLSGAVDAAYVYGGYAASVTAKGGHPLTDAEKIAKLGVPGIDSVAVSDTLVKNNPDLVQKYVCAEVQATRDLTGSQSAKYLTQAAGVQGVPPGQIQPATRAYPFIPLSQQLYWLGSKAGDTSSPIVKAYQQTGQFLVKQGRLTSAPSAAQIATHIDPTFVKKALSGGC